MIKVGLTGGIGAGKSTVAQIFKSLGVPVFDADDAAKKILVQDEEVKQKVINAFGEFAYENGMPNRKYIASIVFKDPYQLEILNSIVHPATIKAAENWFHVQAFPYCIKEAALLFETGTVSGLDYVIGVTAPKALRIQRVMQRDALSRDDVLARMQNQIDETIKIKLCDFVIQNNETTSLIEQVLFIHQTIMQQT